MLPAENTGGGAATSPAVADAVRARRLRLERNRQGLNSGVTPAATAAGIPAITPAVGTADALDGGVELATGEGVSGDMLGTSVVREAIRVLSRVGMDATLASSNQVTGDAAGYKTPAQTEVAQVQPPALPEARTRIL